MRLKNSYAKFIYQYIDLQNHSDYDIVDIQDLVSLNEVIKTQANHYRHYFKIKKITNQIKFLKCKNNYTNHRPSFDSTYIL